MIAQDLFQSGADIVQQFKWIHLVLPVFIRSPLGETSHFPGYRDALAKSSQPTSSENSQPAASFFSLPHPHIQSPFAKYLLRAYSDQGPMLIILGDKMVKQNTDTSDLRVWTVWWEERGTDHNCISEYVLQTDTRFWRKKGCFCKVQNLAWTQASC